MDLSVSVSITPKGVEEIKNRVYKLSIKKRSVLILLEKPQAIEFILQKSVFPQDEIIDEINALIREGFVTVGGGAVSSVAAPTSGGGATPAAGGAFQLSDDIIISESKFLLVDFCVDTFGTQSQVFLDEIGECKNAKSLSMCLRNIYTATEKQFAGRLSILQGIIKEINETA